MFSVVMFILKLLRRRFYIRIDQLAAGSHLGNFFQDNCVVNSLMCIFSPGKRSVVFAEDCRNCFVIFIFEIVGKQTKVKVVKNKVAPPFRRAEFDIMFGEGISRAGEIIDLGAELGIIKKSGSWFSYNETKIAQGRDAAKQVILDNPELAEELEGLIFAELRKDK